MYVYFVWHVVCGDPCVTGPLLNPGPEWGWSVDVCPASAPVSQATT
jgi:hypothetical protein